MSRVPKLRDDPRKSPKTDSPPRAESQSRLRETGPIPYPQERSSNIPQDQLASPQGRVSKPTPSPRADPLSPGLIPEYPPLDRFPPPLLEPSHEIDPDPQGQSGPTSSYFPAPMANPRTPSPQDRFIPSRSRSEAGPEPGRSPNNPKADLLLPMVNPEPTRADSSTKQSINIFCSFCKLDYEYNGQCLS
uniref:Uncharacterized protein n=1 Tax=Acrobeloides nanus TaxID=290746 RepID=A0A914D384_9BILA